MIQDGQHVAREAATRVWGFGHFAVGGAAEVDLRQGAEHAYLQSGVLGVKRGDLQRDALRLEGLRPSNPGARRSA